MSLIDNTSTLLREQLGKGSGVVFTTVAQTGKDWYAVHFVTQSVVSAITAEGLTNATALQTTLPAGTTLLMGIQAMTLTSGIAIGYKE